MDGFSGCYADVEHVAVSGERALIMPAHEVSGDVRRLKSREREPARERARQRARKVSPDHVPGGLDHLVQGAWAT
jgi:hypothetical protein